MHAVSQSLACMWEHSTPATRLREKLSLLASGLPLPKAAPLLPRHRTAFLRLPLNPDVVHPAYIQPRPTSMCRQNHPVPPSSANQRLHHNPVIPSAYQEFPKTISMNSTHCFLTGV